MPRIEESLTASDSIRRAQRIRLTTGGIKVIKPCQCPLARFSASSTSQTRIFQASVSIACSFRDPDNAQVFSRVCAALKIASNVRGSLELTQNKVPRFKLATPLVFTQLAIATIIGHNPNENSSHSSKMPTTKISPDADLPQRAHDESKTQHVPRFDSRNLFGHGKSVHIEHEGKVYELRVTRLGKLILTA